MDRITEVLADFFEPHTAPSSPPSTVLASLLSRDFAPANNAGRPPNTNLLSALIGGRKLQIRNAADGRILRHSRAYRASEGDLPIWAAGSCSTDAPQIPGYLTRNRSRVQGIQSVREMLPPGLDLKGIIQHNLPTWSSSTMLQHPVAMCGNWDEFADGSAFIHETRTRSGNNSLLAVWSHQGPPVLRAAACVGPQADQINRACIRGIESYLERDFASLIPELADFPL
jgi:hypothetical protein